MLGRKSCFLTQDKSFVLEGIEHSFSILDSDEHLDTFCLRNYGSATKENKLATEKQIQQELALGHYVQCDFPPLAVSSLGAIILTKQD